MTKDIELLRELKGQYVEKMVVDSRLGASWLFYEGGTK